LKAKIYFIALIATLTVGCSQEPMRIIVANGTDIAREGELITLTLPDTFTDDDVSDSYVLKGVGDIPVPYLLTETDGSRQLLFQSDVPAYTSIVYSFGKGKPATLRHKTAARHVPERKDDFAWENDFAAYRMYGPALEAEYPSNGIDLWLKCTDTLIMDRFYADELERGLSYHVNRGLGLDCYGVGHTAGAGGIAPSTADGRLWIGNHYDRFEIKESNALRSVFTLYYDSVVIGDKLLTQEITITTEAGSMLNRADVRYKGDAEPFRLAAAIALHNDDGTIFADTTEKVIAYAENAISNQGVFEGRSYVGVYMPSASGNAFKKDNHWLITSPYTSGNLFTYYFGGGWSQWKFPSDEAWFNALLRFARSRETPLKVAIGASK
jgi:hypothetical protein